MVYLYRISHIHFYQGSDYLLVHDREFSENEWMSMVREAVRWSAEELLKTCSRHIYVSDILRKAVEYLCNRYGFREVRYTQQLVIEVAPNPLYASRRDIEFLKSIGLDEELIRKIVLHNIGMLGSRYE